MALNVLTIEDLQEFKTELFEELKTLMAKEPPKQEKRWLRSQEVMNMLGVSPGTLQNLRINRVIPYTRMGGLIYYDHKEIVAIMEANKVEKGFG